jgi:hypothetical protein
MESGWPDGFVKYVTTQNVEQYIFLSNFLQSGKNRPNIWTTSVMKKLAKINNRPIGGDSPKLVTLLGTFRHWSNTTNKVWSVELQ